MVISDTYLLIILLIWLLKSVYLSNTYFYEHYELRVASRELLQVVAGCERGFSTGERLQLDGWKHVNG